MSFAAEYAVHLNCAAGAGEADKVASLTGDGGYIFKPAHICVKALANLDGVLGDVGADKRMPTRLMDASALRVFIMTEALAARPVASWIVGPERWARFFQDAAASGLKVKEYHSVSAWGEALGTVAGDMDENKRLLGVNDVLGVPLHPAGAGTRTNGADDWFITLSGAQVSCRGCTCPLQARPWVGARAGWGPGMAWSAPVATLSRRVAVSCHKGAYGRAVQSRAISRGGGACPRGSARPSRPRGGLGQSGVRDVPVWRTWSRISPKISAIISTAGANAPVQ